MLPPLNCICHYKLRRDIKSDHGIDQGGCIRDALAVSFCACCALIQDWLDFLVYNIVQIQRGNIVAARNLRALGSVGTLLMTKLSSKCFKRCCFVTAIDNALKGCVK